VTGRDASMVSQYVEKQRVFCFGSLTKVT